MSCEIRVTAYIENIPSIRRCLFPTDDHRGSDSWLQTCKISVSPTGDLIAIANERKLVVLTAKWDSSKSLNTFQIIFAETIHEYDKVKAVLCLPIIGFSHSSRVGPDWTCIVIGFDSGFVRFYTENCDCLLEEQFHCENITNIKCQSQHNPRSDLLPELNPEELYVQYQSNVCVINGQQLFSNLKALRAQLAKILVASKDISSDINLNQLNVRKWGFQDQTLISDVAVVGLNLSGAFDHLLTASVCGGFESKYRSTAPNSTLVLAAGSKPFLGFHYALEGVNQPILSDVAKAVASKLKSALPGWLTGTKVQQEKEVSLAMQAIDTMGLRFGLCDLRRTAIEIILSPNRKLAAVTDTLGRVILVDCFRGIGFKVFKGYREAQCAFLQVPDERRSKHRLGNKVALFLVIYCPKKGTLEIFTLQQGIKIAIFSASKYSRLLYITHGLMGFTGTSKSNYVCHFTCILMDNDGQIKEIMVPFHYALAEKNSKRARDIHLYKKLRQLIKCEDIDLDRLQNESYNICAEIKTVEIKMQTVEMLVASKNISAQVILKCVEYFIESLIEDIESEAINTFKITTSNIKALLGLYLFVTSEDEPVFNNGNGIEGKMVNLEEKELENLQRLLDLATSTKESDLKLQHVTFSNEISSTVSDFLGAFDLSKSGCINLKPKLEDHVLYKTSEVLFKKYISGDLTNFVNFNSAMVSSAVSVKDMFDLAIYFWVNRDLDINQNLEKDLRNFSKLIFALVTIANKEGLTRYENDSVSTFWSAIRTSLANSSRPFPALMAAMLCKNVSQKYDVENSEENIEVLSQENIDWSLLIGKLEDVSTLNIILSIKLSVKSALPILKHDRVNVSLKYILENGWGSVSELTAQWLTSCGMDPQNIVVNEIIFNNNQKDINNANDNNKEQSSGEDIQISEGMHLDIIEQVKSDSTFKYLNILKQQFPYSLEASALLANMCWEYALAWRKDIICLENLKAATSCLKNITDRHIKQGLYQLVWNTHLKIVLESCCKLINKVGKLPKERLCQQDTGLTDKQITMFISICTEFLDSFLDVANFNCDTPKTNLKFEAIWENGGHQSLVELAVQQKEVNYNLLYLHYQLSIVLQMISMFSVKHSKLVSNLFEPSIVNLFFTDFQRKLDINWSKSDIKINSSRLQFLRKVIISSMETMTLNEHGAIYCHVHVEWMQKCLILARIWNLDTDTLKRFQVAQLYISGFDLVAQDLIPAINNLNSLGEELLKIASKRLSQFLSSAPNLSENITAVSPVLTRYIETLNGDWCSPSSLQNIKVLATQTLQCLVESNKEYYTLAELLLDACNTLQEINC